VSRSLTRLQALALGLVMLLGLVLAGSGLFAVGSRGWFGKDALTLRAGFAEIRGVEPGTRVRIQGIDAGEVAALEPPDKPGGQVFLKLRIKGEYRHLIWSTSRVQIVSEGLIGGKVVEVLPGNPDAGGTAVADGAVLQSEKAPELAGVLDEAGGALKDIRSGKGTLGKLATDSQAHDALLQLLQQSKETMASIEMVSDAVHRLPVVGGYVENPVELLERPDCNRDRRWFAEKDLFVPGEAQLTAQGKQHLDEVAPWLEGMKHKGSELVVVSYADPASGIGTQSARNLTRKQSQAVCVYLKEKHAVQKMGWFTSRKVTPLGQGLNQPSGEREKLPAARVEVVVFVPVAK
jgi:phospholipid/cholesterol/gamma-HCH transport system substrate-binding protein